MSRNRHPLNQSRFFKLKSPAQLADLLQIPLPELDQLLIAPENYIRFTTDNGREIQWPKPILRRAHKRAATLLARIETPEFLHSAIKGRSYVTNAATHSAAYATVKIDVRKFFQSVRAAAVFHFFKDRMLCEPDVAAILTKLLTVDGHLPTGSSASPILSYLAYADMFGEIDALAKARRCTMTCYVDDMAFSGPGVTRGLIYEVRRIMRRYRLWAHKTKLFRPGQPRVITGIAITNKGRALPNKRQKLITQDLLLLAAAGDDTKRLDVTRRLVSRMFEAAQIDPAWRPRAYKMLEQRQALEQKIAAEISSQNQH